MSDSKSSNAEFLKDSVTDELEIIDIFKAMARRKEKLWLWQENKENPNQRSIHLCYIRKVDVLGKLLWLNPLNQSKFNFTNTQSDFFIYSKVKNMAVRFQAREKDSEFMSLTMPKKLNALSDDFSQKLHLVEKENEEENLHKREVPRKQAKGKQTIRAQKQGENQPKIYNLYDISAGGLAIKWEDPGYFQKNDLITIFSINDSTLKQPIVGQVVSVREISEEETFKVGVKFVQKD